MAIILEVYNIALRYPSLILAAFVACYRNSDTKDTSQHTAFQTVIMANTGAGSS